jgi:hypothetical protein
MLRAIADASGKDSASALAEIGSRALHSRSKRPQAIREDELKTKERLATLHPDVSNMGKKAFES